MAGNYRSHLGGENVTATITSTTTVTTDLQTGATVVATTTDNDVRRPGEIPAKFRTPQPFLKPTACLTPHLSEIRLPNDAGPVHYEAEMVLVIGKRASDVSPQEARDHIFGITCGNDVSARQWQKNDIQWWRAKGADTFGPVGPWIVTGLNDADRTLRLRLNGQLRQEAKTSELIHGAAEIVSFISRHTTLFPGDLIFTGTPGSTDVLAPGDVVEVELEGVGTLRNTVVSED